MKIIKPSILALSAVLVLGVIPEAQATVIQPIGLTTQQDHIVLARHGDGHHHGHGGHWRGHGGHWGGHGGYWHGGRHWRGGGAYVAPGYYYGPTFHRTCHWNHYNQYVCHRRYY